MAPFVQLHLPTSPPYHIPTLLLWPPRAAAERTKRPFLNLTHPGGGRPHLPTSQPHYILTVEKVSQVQGPPGNSATRWAPGGSFAGSCADLYLRTPTTAYSHHYALPPLHAPWSTMDVKTCAALPAGVPHSPWSVRHCAEYAPQECHAAPQECHTTPQECHATPCYVLPPPHTPTTTYSHYYIRSAQGCGQGPPVNSG